MRYRNMNDKYELLEKRIVFAVSSGPQPNFEAPPSTPLLYIDGTDRALEIFSSVYYNDSNIDFREMSNLLSSTKTDGSISSSEIKSLENIIDQKTMPDYVRYLSSAVVKGSSANEFFQGEVLGDIKPGSTSDHMEKMIDKWFKGKDRPSIDDWLSSGARYEEVKGSLFVNDVSGEDVRQGAVSDCYLVNAFMSIADAEDDSGISNMFLEKSNVWVVRFYNRLDYSQVHYVTVDRFLPVKSNKEALFADYGSTYDDDSNELWVALAEKAYVQFATQIEGIRHPDLATNNYSSINGGVTNYALRNILGTGIRGILFDDPTKIIEGLEDGFVYTINFGNHAWTINNYNKDSGEFFIRNPWGYNHHSVTYEEIKEMGLDKNLLFKVYSYTSQPIEDNQSPFLLGSVNWL